MAVHGLLPENTKLGHQVQLIAPQHVKDCVTGNKNEFIYAEAIFESASRPRTSSVQVKSVDQQVLSTLHKLCKSMVSRRTGAINQVNRLLLEFGVIFLAGYAAPARVPTLMKEHNLPLRLRQAIDRIV